MATLRRTSWKHPDKITTRFRSLIEGAEADCGVYLPTMSDWRNPATFKDAGAAPTSRHYYGEAVDKDIPYKGHGTSVGLLITALIRRATVMAILNELEIEIVASERDSHLHIALDPSQENIAIFAAAD